MGISKTILLILLPIILVTLCSCSTGTEKVKYELISKDDKIEVRQYESYIIAETTVDESFGNAGNAGFRVLFAYISGENQKGEPIAMTAPVNQQAKSEKIAMTAPVNMQKQGEVYKVSFVMPEKYTMETLPMPTDEKVIIREVPGFKAVALKYSGNWSQKAYDQNKELLEKYIEKNGLRVTGSDIFARYDPPFQLPILRRNEVVIPVE